MIVRARSLPLAADAHVVRRAAEASVTNGPPKWRQVSAEAFREARSSGQTVQLDPAQLPVWATKVPEIQAVWARPFLEPRSIPSTGTSTPVTGSFDVERRGKQPGDPLKYDRYYYICMHDGSVWQSGPYKDLDYGHHLAERPAFLNHYPSPPSRADA